MEHQPVVMYHTHDDPSMTGGMVEGENGEVTWQETPNPEDTTGN